MGTNLAHRHPEVFKAGILKKARNQFKGGEYEVAKNTLMKGFRVADLRWHFEQDVVQKERDLAEKKKKDEAAAKARGDVKFTKAKGTESLLEQLREDPDEA